MTWGRLNDAADKLQLRGTSCWGGVGKGREVQAAEGWESGGLESQSRSPGAVGELVPGARLMSGLEAAGWRTECLRPAATSPCLGAPFPFKIQAAEVPSTAEGREIRKCC